MPLEGANYVSIRHMPLGQRKLFGKNLSNESSDGKLVFTSLFKTVVVFDFDSFSFGLVVMGLIAGLPMRYV